MVSCRVYGFLQGLWFPAEAAGAEGLPTLQETAPQKGDLELFVWDLVTFEVGKVTKSRTIYLS